MNATEASFPLRLNRLLARAGFGSRRGVEDLIRAGRVRVNGTPTTDLSCKVGSPRDLVEVDGVPVVLPARWRAYAFHKPLGVVSTLKGQRGQRDLAYFRQRAGLPARIMPVGRLDAETTGLLLWTDDGELAQLICRPASGVWKRYEVRLEAPLPPAGREALAHGTLALDGHPSRPWLLEPLAAGDRRSWLVALHEGRKRQIRRLFGALGLEVVSLHRVAVGPIRLGRLRPGDFRRLPEAQLRALRRAADPEPLTDGKD